MTIEILFVSRKLTPFQDAWCEEYAQRLRPLCSLKITALKESSLSERSQNMAKTWKEIQKRLEPRAKKVLLDLGGKHFSSEDFSKNLSQWISLSGGQIQFVIGGSYGLPPEARKGFDEVLSLSKFTFPHRLALLVLLEQVYRAFTIQNGHPYHHG